MPRHILCVFWLVLTGLMSSQSANAGLISHNTYITSYSNHFVFMWNQCSNRKLEPEHRIQYCKSMLERGLGDETHALTEIGIAYMEEHKYDMAVDAFKTARSHDASALVADNKMDEALVLNGQYDSAMADLADEIKLNPRSANFYNERCWLRAIAAKELDGALADCNEALSIKPNNAGILDSRGLVEFKSGKLKDAATDYDAALGISPKFPSSLFMRGIIKLRSGDMAGGNGDIAAAKEQDPQIAETYAVYGVTP